MIYTLCRCSTISTILYAIEFNLKKKQLLQNAHPYGEIEKTFNFCLCRIYVFERERERFICLLKISLCTHIHCCYRNISELQFIASNEVIEINLLSWAIEITRKMKNKNTENRNKTKYHRQPNMELYENVEHTENK